MSDKSSESRARGRLYESLSAAMDGQASELELRRILDGMPSDQDIRKKAVRYQRIGDSIRRETNQFADIDLTANISSAIEAEASFSSTHNADARGSRFHAFMNSLKKLDPRNESFGRVAVAASVFFAVVLGSRSYLAPQNDLALIADAGVSPSTTTLVQPVQVNSHGYGASGILAGYHSTKNESISPEQLAYAQRVADRATRERFRAYALQHAELSVMSTGQGVLPFARLTSFDVQ